MPLPSNWMVTEVLTLEETIQLILKHKSEYERKDILKFIEEKRQELGPEVVTFTRHLPKHA
jgi:hypothetical protein